MAAERKHHDFRTGGTGKLLFIIMYVSLKVYQLVSILVSVSIITIFASKGIFWCAQTEVVV